MNRTLLDHDLFEGIAGHQPKGMAQGLAVIAGQDAPLAGNGVGATIV